MSIDRSPEVLVTPVPACRLKPGDRILVSRPYLAQNTVQIERVTGITYANEDVNILIRMGGEILCPASQVYYKVEAR